MAGDLERTVRPAAILAADAPLRTRPSAYPEMLAIRLAGREKRPLGDLFGLRNFGVNLTRLAPGAVSSLHHVHSRQDELIYVLRASPRSSWATRRSNSGQAWWQASPQGARRIIWRTALSGTW